MHNAEERSRDDQEHKRRDRKASAAFRREHDPDWRLRLHSHQQPALLTRAAQRRYGSLKNGKQCRLIRQRADPPPVRSNRPLKPRRKVRADLMARTASARAFKIYSTL